MASFDSTLSDAPTIMNSLNDAEAFSRTVQESFNLSVLCSPQSPAEGDDAMDIVFVHGVGRQSTDTWKSQSIHWPCDMLAVDLPSARILTFDYDFDILPSSGVEDTSGTSTLEGAGIVLLRSLCRVRSGNSAEHKLFFICHAFGGLIVKSALNQACLHQDGEGTLILKATEGICFFGTPHRDFKLIKWVQRRAQFCVLPRVSAESFEAVRSDEALNRVSDLFESLLRDSRGKHIHLLNFYEEELEPTVAGRTLIVPKVNAINRDTFETHYAVHRNHSSLGRIESRSEETYRKTLEFINPWLGKIAPDERADVWSTSPKAAAPDDGDESARGSDDEGERSDDGWAIVSRHEVI